MFLHQTLCFHNLSYPHYALLRLLETLRHAFSSTRSPPTLTPTPNPTPNPPSPPAHALSFADEAASESVSESCMFVDNGSDGSMSHDSGSVVSRHGSVDSVALGGDSGRCLPCDGSAASRHDGADADGGGCDEECRGLDAAGRVNVPALCAADGAQNDEDACGRRKVVDSVPSGSADDDDRRMSHDGNGATCYRGVECVARGGSDRPVSHGDRATGHSAVRCVACGDGDRRVSHGSDKATSDKDVNDIDSDRRMSHDGVGTSCRKCALSHSGETSDTVSAAPDSRAIRSTDADSPSSSCQGNDTKDHTNSSRGGDSAKPKNHHAGAKDRTGNHRRGSSFGSIALQETEPAESFVSQASAEPGSITKNGLRTKRTRVSCDDSEPCVSSPGLDCLSSSATSQSRQHGEDTDFPSESADGTTGRCGDSSEGKVIAQVPLEVVPMVEMINGEIGIGLMCSRVCSC